MNKAIVIFGVSAAIIIGLTSVSFNAKTPDAQINDVKQSAAASVHHIVPFVAQAPLGNWQDKRQAYGCEEASALMAMRWARGADKQTETLTAEEAIKEITAAADYELQNFGYHEDTSAKDTLERIIKGYFKYNNAALVYDVNINDIKVELAKNRLVILPVRGLKNPYYAPPGPSYHMILIVGYDDAAQEFIAHDPGTRHGENFRYPYQTIGDALGDYESGRHKEVMTKRTAMIVVAK